jgi:uncharacterized glyoxalase superfamily protein PhnB
MAEFTCVTPYLSTHNIAGTIEFYAGVLGFSVELIHPGPPEIPTLCILERGGASLMFQSTFWPDEPTLTGALHFGLEPGGVLETFERVRPYAEILWGPEVYWYGRREFSCEDPVNGYALIFSEETAEPPTCLKE